MEFRDGLVGKIDEEDAMTLEKLSSTEEIREAVSDCESSKAPGCNGYNMNFIKRCWGEIRSEFTAAVIGFFQTSRLLTNINITWVALAPKFVGAKEMKDLRPISMVGCVYKVISKVLVRKMRAVMLGKKKAAIIKLDFQKAYDIVKWSFVDIVLQKMGFGHRWRAWVMECVTTASMSILINGLPSKPFKIERGLRQGDPFSPFLFVLVVDVLHRMVGEWVQRMCNLLSCKVETLLVKYLGIAFGANLRLVNTWKPIIDKVKENSMPKAVAEKLISSQRRFLWSKEDGRNGMALVRWEVEQAPKKLSGLGVGDVMIRNIVLLFKWWWQFVKEECPLWKKVVCSCNNLNPNELLSTQVLPTRGGPWKYICQLQITNQRIRDKMVTGLSMVIGDGRRTQFWEDVWCRVLGYQILTVNGLIRVQ
ncbi:uncharacterized protein LOC110269204 [Arachis ipaensis]|uniref:uncharacterized protein LOC110269204 n=1 Tax=Arachis ipaensis TaxID=130454 RepID=UPI000A2B3A5E|nr:uncharacterized protein LOC110269204 [Arachis ipaensis]